VARQGAVQRWRVVTGDGETPEKLGDCYENCANMIAFTLCDSHGMNAVLVHGIVKNSTLGTWMAHAWIEFADGRGVMDCTRGPIHIVPKEDYYEAGEVVVSECIRYSRVAAMRMMLAHNTYGPWEGNAVKFGAKDDSSMLPGWAPESAGLRAIARSTPNGTEETQINRGGES